MLSHEFKEATNGSVTIDTMSKETLTHALSFIYADKLTEITMDQCLELVAADFLQFSPLKSAAIEKWKTLFLTITEPVLLFEAVQKLIDTIEVVPDDSWYLVKNWLVVGISADRAKFNIAQRTSKYITFLFGLFARALLLLKADLLAEWTSANLIERLPIAHQLARSLDFGFMSIRTVAQVSKSPAFPADYMLQFIQTKVEEGDQPVTGHVTYDITTRRDVIVNLEFETGFGLFWFKGFSQKKEMWEFTKVPNDCNTEVRLEHREAKWAPNSTTGALQQRESLVQYQGDDGAVTIIVLLKRKDYSSKEPKYSYTLGD